MPRLQTTNPRSGEVDYVTDAAGPAEVKALAATLREAQPAWAAELPPRLRAMQAFAGALSARREELGLALQADTGRRMMSYLEVDLMVGRVHYWLERAPQLLKDTGEALGPASGLPYRHQRVPYPLVGVISPWNFPLTLALTDSIPALFAGCAVLLKPSEVTPRFAEVLNACIGDVAALHPVFRAVVGDGSTGSAVVDAVDMLCFTGSVETGRRVALQAAGRLIPVCLELGGKDAAIVLADADVEAAADAILRSAAGSCGQACMSLERVYAHRGVFEALLAALVLRSEASHFNAPDIGQGVMTPFIDPRQADKVAAQLEDALSRGAKMHCGGPPQRIDGGRWMAPTVLTEISRDMLLMQEETFGPLIPLLPFDSDEEAIALANDSAFGLSGSVFGEEHHALEVATELNAGAIGINDASMTAMIHDIEKQSFGQSGLGPSRMGDSGLLRFLRSKALMIQRDAPTPLSALDEARMPS
jgi:succinate-semialdehyde dehydrogenase/glutarate-semialdehyde dehydrogenase